MRFALAAWMALALAADPPKKDADKKPCELEPYSRKHFPAVKKLLTKHLSEKHAKQMTDLLQKPCEPINQGLVINTCLMRNTNKELAAFTTAALNELAPEHVAGVWALTPSKPRIWALKSFVASLVCTPQGGSRMFPAEETGCREKETNVILKKFQTARLAFSDLQLMKLDMAPFPRIEDEDEVDEVPDAVLQEELRVARARRDLEGVRRYARRLALPQKQIEWLVSEFAPSAADVLTNPNATTSEPAWFKPVARSCRKQASLKAPGLEDADSANLTDLDLAVATQFWAWHYKTCHKSSVEFAYDHRNDHTEL